MSYLQGNAYEDRGPHQWFIGSFMSEADGLRKDGRVEVKWASLRAGEAKGAWTEVAATTLAVLIKGKFTTYFKDREALLDKEGDYVLYPPHTPHTWRAEEDSLMIVMRWPSENNIVKEVPGPA